MLTLDIMHRLQAAKPKNFQIWREDSSWSCHDIMRRLMGLIVKCLEECMHSHQMILVMDVAKAHFHRSIFAHASRLGLRLVYVPAKITWLVQPADTHIALAGSRAS